MRVSPVGHAFDTLEEVLAQAEASAAVTHNHPEGIKGAQAVAAAIFMARQKADKEDIREYVMWTFGYSLKRSLKKIRPDYLFDVTCQGSVPQAIIAFLEADSFENAVRNAVSLGGDSDTQACIAGGIAGAYYGVPDEIREEVFRRLDRRLGAVTREFVERYGI
jgi:ADP-ribosylglycohydrolase